MSVRAMTVCPQCGKAYEPVLGVRPNRSALIQDQFPKSTAEEREQLLSGVCSTECWRAMFSWPDDGEPADDCGHQIGES